MKKWVVLALTFLLAFPAFSANFRKGRLIEVKNLSGDLYALGRETNIAGTLDGDLFALSRRVIVNGNITGGASIIAEKGRIKGVVGRSIRFIGRILEIDGEIKGDVLFMGQELRINPSGKVDGEIYSGSSTVRIDGTVNGPVHIGCNEFIFSGEIASDLFLKAREISLEGGKIEGKLEYWSKKQVKIPEGMVAGGALFHKYIKHPEKALGKGKLTQKKRGAPFFFTKTGFRIAWFISALFLGYLIFLLFPSQVKTFASELIERPLRTFLLGTAGLILIPILILLFLVIIFTIPMDLVILPLYFIGLYLGKLLAGLAIGILVLKWIFRKEITPWITYPVGLVILVLLSFIPYIGWFLMLIARLWGFGAFFHKLKV